MSRTATWVGALPLADRCRGEDAQVFDSSISITVTATNSGNHRIRPCRYDCACGRKTLQRRARVRLSLTCQSRYPSAKRFVGTRRLARTRSVSCASSTSAQQQRLQHTFCSLSCARSFSPQLSPFGVMRPARELPQFPFPQDRIGLPSPCCRPLMLQKHNYSSSIRLRCQAPCIKSWQREGRSCNAAASLEEVQQWCVQRPHDRCLIARQSRNEGSFPSWRGSRLEVVEFRPGFYSWGRGKREVGRRLSEAREYRHI